MSVKATITIIKLNILDPNMELKIPTHLCQRICNSWYPKKLSSLDSLYQIDHMSQRSQNRRHMSILDKNERKIHNFSSHLPLNKPTAYDQGHPDQKFSHYEPASQNHKMRIET